MTALEKLLAAISSGHTPAAGTIRAAELELDADVDRAYALLRDAIEVLAREYPVTLGLRDEAKEARITAAELALTSAWNLIRHSLIMRGRIQGHFSVVAVVKEALEKIGTAPEPEPPPIRPAWRCDSCSRRPAVIVHETGRFCKRCAEILGVRPHGKIV